VLALAIVACALLAGEAHAGKPTKSEESTAGPLSVSSLKAVFEPKLLATKYTVDVTDLSAKKPQFEWVLELRLVDPAGSSPVGNPASHAAVDSSCNNAYLPDGTSSDNGRFGDGFYTYTYWTKLGETFTWYHGDKGSYPPSGYGCDHTKMGPSGHQGTVELFVSTADGNWVCKASLDGSNLSTTPEFSPAPVCEGKKRFWLDFVSEATTSDIQHERTAVEAVGKDNKSGHTTFMDTADSLKHLASTLELHDGKSGAVDDLNGASKLDEDAAAQDLGTKAGAEKALADSTAALKLKKKAVAAVNALAAKEPAAK
jgi:hypothetical protein